MISSLHFLFGSFFGQKIAERREFVTVLKLTCHLLRGQLTRPAGCPLGLLMPWSWETKRGVRVVNENSGLITVYGIQEMPGPVWERRRGQVWRDFPLESLK